MDVRAEVNPMVSHGGMQIPHLWDTHYQLSIKIQLSKKESYPASIMPLISISELQIKRNSSI